MSQDEWGQEDECSSWNTFADPTSTTWNKLALFRIVSPFDSILFPEYNGYDF